MSEVVAEFIYQTANPIIKDLAKTQGHQAYINSFNAKASFPEWKSRFMHLMDYYQGEKFSFQQLQDWCLNDGQIQPRYLDITMALYNSLKQHYI
ncbi:unnamed protein product [marine sediment metagenome]|uniref:Uncharacterized protein n=1 Tax=marine sediment metagenome TaxID=412755 RepID=X0UBB4_9ZZZZ